MTEAADDPLFTTVYRARTTTLRGRRYFHYDPQCRELAGAEFRSRLGAMLAGGRHPCLACCTPLLALIPVAA